MSRRFEDIENEEFVDELIKGLTEVYSSARTDIMAQLSKAGLAQLDENRRASSLLRQVRAVVDRLDAAAGDFAANGIARGYKAGQNIAGEVLSELGVDEQPDWDARIHTDAVDVIAKQMAIDALEKNGTITANVSRALRSTKQSTLAERQINEQIAAGLIQGETRKLTSKRIAQKLIEELGEGKLMTAGARQFKPEEYAELLARTRTREAVTEGILISAGQVGIDLFQVSVHDNPCARCLPYQGRIFSRSGTHPDFPPMGETKPPFHPRCKHVMVPVLEEVLRSRGQYDSLVALSKDPQLNVAGSRDYAEALGLPPPAPIAGKGPRVSAALKYPKRSSIEPVAKRTLQAIDSVHSDGKLPAIALDGDTDLGRTNGMFTAWRNGQVESIQVHPNGETKHLTLAHEIGHFLDFSGVEPTAQWSSSTNPAFKPLMDAIAKTKAITRLAKMEAGPDVIKVTRKGVRVPVAVSKPFVRYLLEPHEQFARAYAQYVATRSGDEVMLGELAKRRGKRTENVVWYPFQWSDNDFEPVVKAMDALFQELGWIR